MKLLVLAESLRINNTSSGIVSSTFISMLSKIENIEIQVITQNDFNEEIKWFNSNVNVIKFNIPNKINFLEKIPKIRGLTSYIYGFNLHTRKIINEWENQISHHLNKSNFDYIFVLGSGMSFYPHFALLNLKTNIPVIINIHDPFPIHTYPIPYKKPRSIISSIQEKKFNIVLQKAYKITLPSRYLMESLIEFYPILVEKGIIIPHIGTFLNNLPAIEDDLKINLIKNKINILHAGSLLGPRNPVFLLKAIYNLLSNHQNLFENVHFTFIGGIAKEHQNIIIENKFKDSISFINQRISYAKSIELIKQSDAIFVIEAISSFSPFMPGKIADIVYHEKPIIALCPKNSETMRLLGIDYPYFSELDNVAKIENMLLNFINNFEKISNKVDLDILKNYISIKSNLEIINKNIFN